jgi:hypothetical protein
MSAAKKPLLLTVYALATIQFVWCYLWLTRPYVNTLQYENGTERMPFQGRCLMVLPMRWAHGSRVLAWLTHPFMFSTFWFPRPVQPEVLVQAFIDVASLLVTGICVVKIYEASSVRRTLIAAVYPLLLVVCGATYVMHTVQNFRFIYDLPSLAFFAAAFYVLYFKRHWFFFVVLFIVATINRETTVLLLPLYLINASTKSGRIQIREMLRFRLMVVVVPLGILWIAWQIFVRHLFAGNVSEFYPRLGWNIKSLLAPHAWPQLLSACAYLLPFIVIMRHRICDSRIRAWLWIIPLWIGFMFSFGILIETRVYGELIPLVVCSTMLILEDGLIQHFIGSVAAQTVPQLVSNVPFHRAVPSARAKQSV